MSRNLLLSFACAAGTLVACAGEALSFTHRPQLAGKASLTSPGFEVTRTLGEVALAPELRLPIELVYDHLPNRQAYLASPGGRRSWKAPSAGTRTVSSGRRPGASG